ncbi:cupin domain-containing protein [Halorussus salinisoli]|uniref:cupin domain-containing protein n=1 Tax=Halorussus salinisoli TaxID=2558242 RepID=UPI0010C2142E|nr:cupin domain-containing protein [Halorussus salinisoli]
MTSQESGGQHATLSEFETGLKMEEAVWREAEWGDMRVGYETYLQDFDDAQLLKGLPNDRCQCPHWGYLLSGRMTVRYADHEEVVEAGDVYYMAPDHTIAVDAGTVLIEFSPREEFQKTVEVGERNIAELEDARNET